MQKKSKIGIQRKEKHTFKYQMKCKGSFNMKKVFSFILVFAVVLCSFSYVLAADEYSFELKVEGQVVKNIEKDASVLLKGVDATAYTNVIIKVEVTGPATPKLLATDSAGTTHDIAQLGYWGTVGGFAVQGTFTNETAIKATFPEEGNYTITLSLVDVSNANQVITTKTFTIEVYEDELPENTIDNSVTENNVVEELPKTGTSVAEYMMYIAFIAIGITVAGMYLNRRRA